MATSPPSISGLPLPPNPNDRATFNTRAYPWSVALDPFADEVEAVAANVYANAQVAETQAALATTNGATQVALAADQVALATTNGATQVALAADQVALAADQVALSHADAIATAADRVQTGLDRTATAADRVQTGLDATAAQSSMVAASKLNLGNKASAPALDNQGAALLAGATYYDTTLDKWRVWTGIAWGDGISAVAGVASVNGMTGNVVLPPVQTIAYDARATLRTQTPADGEQAIVDGLGLFVWQPGSTEPDDDESAFATATGVWLLEAAHWDLVDSWQAPDDDVRDAFDEDEPLRFASSFASSFASKVLTGSATCAITSVAANTSTSFTGTVTGAAIGDRVIATPPNQLGSTAADTGRLSYHAWVSTADTVTIMLTNASAAIADTNAAIQTVWPITVIKP